MWDFSSFTLLVDITFKEGKCHSYLRERERERERERDPFELTHLKGGSDICPQSLNY